MILSGNGRTDRGLIWLNVSAQWSLNVSILSTFSWKYFFTTALWYWYLFFCLRLIIIHFLLFVMMHCIFSHINRRTQFENPVLEAKRRLEQQRQMQSQGLSALPLPTIYRGTHGIIIQYVRVLADSQSCTNIKFRAYNGTFPWTI